MLAEQTICETSKRRTRVVLSAITCACSAMMLYFLGIEQFREVLISFAVDRFGESAGEIMPIVLILPAFPILLVPIVAAIAYADRFKTICPSCEQDISNNAHQLLTTKRCPSCSENIVEGGTPRSDAFYKRYMAARSRLFLRYWLWAWPAFGLVCIAWRLFDRTAFQQCPQCLWVAPLIGASSAGWAWIRTRDRGYVPQLSASVVFFGVGATIFWHEL